MAESQDLQLRLSLERLYKDDQGRPIPTVLDILPDGEHIYEPDEPPGAQLGENLRRMFLERGLDFFDQDAEQRRKNKQSDDDPDAEPQSTEAAPQSTDPLNVESVSPEDLLNMRLEIIPQLHIALGEMTLAKDVLSLYIASTAPPNLPSASTATTTSVPALPNDILSSSSVATPPSIPSVQSFNARLVTGGKDEALRKASDLFKSAANAVERSHDVGARYWIDALKIRRGNWGLIPAPLPSGAPTGRGADRTTRDFMVSFGLSESSPAFRQRATGQLATHGFKEPIVFPRRQRTILRISLRSADPSGVARTTCNKLPAIAEDHDPVHAILLEAQREVLEQEIFSLLIRDASALPTSSVRVSERLLVVEATQETELRFELVDRDTFGTNEPGSDLASQAKCDLIYDLLRLLLLREHSHRKSARIGASAVPHPRSHADAVLSPAGPTPPNAAILQPVMDLLQYESFCVRVRAEMNNIVQILRHAGVPIKFRFDAVGDESTEVLQSLAGDGNGRIGGAAVVRIDNSRTLRFTFSSPSSLTAHLSQATLSISSIIQLAQLLRDETEQCLLQRICDMGNELSEQVNGTWLVDLPLSRAVGKWEGCALTFTIACEEDLQCSVSQLIRVHGREETVTKTLSLGQSVPMFSWIRQVIEESLVVQ
ncbi:subunit 17 of mediator complex-domain-containing protein [Gloeopeniophorella convolvens]|nr:subunit 17 of mediator complex-domain-containing protein [Gloeopeniophorella convolvens]